MTEENSGVSQANYHPTSAENDESGNPMNERYNAPIEEQSENITRGKSPRFLTILLYTWKWFWNILTWVPPNCRWDPDSPPRFSFSLNVLFAFAGAFTVANLYYNHPILNILAHDFNVPYEKVAQIPTVMQAGYAIGLLFLCPLGDLFRRRVFVTLLVLFTATLW
jgi:hypothetical protein